MLRNPLNYERMIVLLPCIRVKTIELYCQLTTLHALEHIMIDMGPC